MDGNTFLTDVKERLVPISPILEHAIKKQLNDIGTDAESMTAEQAIEFIDRLTSALDLFLGGKEARLKRNMMMSILRRCAPDYFEEHSLI
jgi:hypothetical protein